jgi:hypothetical protein
MLGIRKLGSTFVRLSNQKKKEESERKNRKAQRG